MANLFLQQGAISSSSATLFDQYLRQGIAATPLAFVYEAQFLRQAAEPEGLQHLVDGVVEAGR